MPPAPRPPWRRIWACFSSADTHCRHGGHHRRSRSLPVRWCERDLPWLPGPVGAVAPALAITAAGGFANDVTLSNGSTVSIFGITLGGTDIAGTPTGPGHATLIAQAGSITQSAPATLTVGTLETGTLAFQAGTFEGGSATPYNVLLEGQNGIGTLSGLVFGGHTFAASSATGSIDLVDAAGLTIAASTRIEAGNTASLPSALTIDDQSGDLSIIGTLQSGIIHAIDSTHGTYTGVLQLQADAGSITEGTAGALLADTLNVHGPSGSVSLAAVGNAVAVLTGSNTAGTNFTFTDSATLPGGLELPHQDVTIDGSVIANSGSLALDVTGGNLVLDGVAVTATTTATIAADLGIVQNTTAIAAGTVAITAGAEFAQFQNGAINATGIPGAGGAAPLLSITAGGGFANDVILSNGTTISLFGMALGGSNQAFSATAPGSIRLLSPAGDITEAAPGTPITDAVGGLLTTYLAFQAGAPGTGAAAFDAWLNNSVNHIGTITGIATTIAGTTTQLSGATGTLSVADAGALTLAATTLLEAGNTTAAETATLFSLSGGITLAGTLVAAGVNLEPINGGIAETTGHIVADKLSFGASTTAYPNVFNVTLNNASNAIGTLTGAPASPGVPSYASGNLSLVDSIGLTIAAGATIEAGSGAALRLHTLSGPISIAGTLSYERTGLDNRLGVMTLTADAGDITETTAASTLFASQLTADAPAGAVTLASAGNFVTSLVGSNTAHGGFTLTDAAAAQPGQNVFIDGAITASDIALTITGGNLNLDTPANLTAGSDNLTADLGILQFGGTVIGHNIQFSAGDEIAQFAHGSISGTPTVIAGHQFSSSVTLHAGTKNAAAGFANDVVLPDGHTITLNGIALGGLVSATGEGVSNITLSTPGGDITQAAPNDSTTGTTTAPPAATGTLITDILQFKAGTPPGARVPATSNAWLNSAANRFGQLGFGGIGAARAVDVVDGENLTLDAATTLSAGGNINLVLTGHTLTQLGGDTLQAGGSAIIDATLLSQSAGALFTAGQNASITGALTQATGASLAATAGTAAIGGALSQTGATLRAGQSVTIGASATQTTSTLTATAGSVSITGALTQGTSHLTAGAGAGIGGALTQTASTLLAGQSVAIGGGASQATSTLTATAGGVSIGHALTQTASRLRAGAGVSIGGTLAQSASTLLAGQSVTIGAAASQSASTLTAATGSVTVAGALTQSAASTLAATAGRVAIARALTQTNSLLSAGAGVSVGGTLSQTAGTLTAGQAVFINGGATQSAASLAANSNVTIKGALAQSAGSTLSSATANVAVTGALTQDTSRLSAATGVSIGGTLSQGASTLAAGKSVTIGGAAIQSASTLTAAGTVSINGALAQSAASTLAAGTSVSVTGAATQTASLLTAGGAVTIAGDITQTTSTLTAGRDVNAAGGLTQSGSTLTAQSGNISIRGTLTQTDASLLDALAGAIGIGQSAASDDSAILAATSVTIGAALSQTGGATLTATAGSVTVGGAATQANSQLSAGAGAMIAGTLSQTTATLTAGDSIAIGGATTQTASTLTATSGSVTITGALAQTGSALTAGQSIGVTSDTTQSASTLAAKGGDIMLGGTLTQTAHSTLTGAASVSVGGNAAQAASLLTAALDVTIGGNLDQASSTLTAGQSVAIGGSLTQTASILSAGGGVTIGGFLVQSSSDLVAAQSVVIAGAAGQTASTLTATAGSVTIGGTLAQATSTLTAGQSITVAESVTQSASALTATAGSIAIGGDLAQTTAFLTAGQSVSVTGDATQSGSTLTAAAGGVTIGGTLAQATSFLTAARAVSVTGDATQSGSALTAAAGGVTIGGTLAQATSFLTAAGPVSVTGDASQSGSTLTAAGVSINGSLAQAASTLIGDGNVTIGGELDQTGSILTIADQVGTLISGSLSVGGNLTQSASQLITGGQINLVGDLLQSAASTLSTTGAHGNSTGALTVGGNLRQSQASLVQLGGVLTVGASLTQDASALEAGTQVGGLGGQDITLSGNGSLTQANGSTIASNAGIGATLAGGFAQDAASKLTANGDIHLVATSGDIAFEGLVRAGQLQPDITLIAKAGNIVSNAGTLNTDSLAAQASGSIALDGTANTFSLVAPQTAGTVQLAGLVAGGSLSLRDSVPLILQDATLSGAGIDLEAPGQSITQQAGRITATSGSATLVAGSLTQDATALITAGAGSLGIITTTGAQSLAGQLAAQTITLSAPGHTIEQLSGSIAATAGELTIFAGDLTQDATGTLSAIAGDLQISSPGTLSFAGLLEAPRILLGEKADGDTLIQDTVAPAAIDFIGGTILTDSSIPIVTGAQPDILAPITAGPNAALGLFATAADFTQSGTTRVQTLAGKPRETFQLRLTGPGGTIAFDPAFSTTSGLYGLNAQLLLDLRTRGMAIGNIVVSGLNVYYGGSMASQIGKATLTGSVNMRTGTAAASTGFIHTEPGVNYEFQCVPHPVAELHIALANHCSARQSGARSRGERGPSAGR